jgi:hypothetical protein
MMDPTREPRSTRDEPIDPRVTLSDEAVVAYLRGRAPGLPTALFDAGAITSRARGALRRRRVRNLVAAVAGAATVYLALALVGPQSVPGVGTVSIPGGNAVRALARDLGWGQPPGPDQWPADVDRLQWGVLPVVEQLGLSYYMPGPPCRVLDYPGGAYRDGDQDCKDRVPFDATARADFNQVTAAVERSGVAVERIVRVGGGIYVQLKDNSWQYNWEYAYLPDVTSPLGGSPDEQWTHIRDQWWFHRTRDD